MRCWFDFWHTEELVRGVREFSCCLVLVDKFVEPRSPSLLIYVRSSAFILIWKPIDMVFGQVLLFLVRVANIGHKKTLKLVAICMYWRLPHNILLSRETLLLLQIKIDTRTYRCTWRVVLCCRQQCYRLGASDWKQSRSNAKKRYSNT